MFVPVAGEADALTATLRDVTDSIAERLTPTTVIRDGKVRAAGRRLEQVIVYDWGFEYAGRQWEQRSFVLLDDGFQINQPVIFPPERRGWWYCDLVAAGPSRPGDPGRSAARPGPAGSRTTCRRTETPRPRRAR
jgi:hypothetical protein